MLSSFFIISFTIVIYIWIILVAQTIYWLISQASDHNGWKGVEPQIYYYFLRHRCTKDGWAWLFSRSLCSSPSLAARAREQPKTTVMYVYFDRISFITKFLSLFSPNDLLLFGLYFTKSLFCSFVLFVHDESRVNVGKEWLFLSGLVK